MTAGNSSVRPAVRDSVPSRNARGVPTSWPLGPPYVDVDRKVTPVRRDPRTPTRVKATCPRCKAMSCGRWIMHPRLGAGYGNFGPADEDTERQTEASIGAWF